MKSVGVKSCGVKSVGVMSVVVFVSVCVCGKALENEKPPWRLCWEILITNKIKKNVYIYIYIFIYIYIYLVGPEKWIELLFFCFPKLHYWAYFSVDKLKTKEHVCSIQFVYQLSIKGMS